GGSHHGRGGRGGGRVGLDGAPLVPDWPGVRDQTGRAVAGGCRRAAHLRGVAGSGLVFHPDLHKVCRLVYNIGDAERSPMTETLTTREAATLAHVTIATIRHWARYGAIRATKKAGRWVIDRASLLRRIELDTRTRKERKRTVELTVENLVAVGGREWKRGDKHRVYFNNLIDFLPLEVEHYKSGRISWAAWEGEEISNRQAYLILESVENVYYDVNEEKFVGRYGLRESRIVSKQEIW